MTMSGGSNCPSYVNNCTKIVLVLSSIVLIFRSAAPLGGVMAAEVFLIVNTDARCS